MRILALLPDDSLHALQRALSPDDAIARVADGSMLLHGAQSARPDAVVVDPVLLDDSEWATAKQVFRLPGAAVLIYSNLNPGSAQRIVAASAVGVHEVLLRHVDDDPEAIRRRLEKIRQPEPPARVFAAIAGRVTHLPPVLQGVMVPYFAAGAVPRWADQVASAAGMPRRSVDRFMERAGLAGTATVLDVARMARVWVPLVEQKQDAGDVAARSGLRRARMLGIHARRLVGVSPSQFADKIDVDSFVKKLTKQIVRGCAAGSAARPAMPRRSA
jgi:hypothetical protein